MAETMDQKKQSLGIPIAIVIASALIAGAIYFSSTSNNSPQEGTPGTADGTTDVSISPVSEDDHLLGSPNAPIKLVEYSDYDCPYCKSFHETLNRIISDYGDSGQVAWVYRQFPLQQLHPNAPRIAIASECIAELGGNEAFWTFTDLVFSERGTNEPTDMTQLPAFAETAGVDTGAFELCLNSDKYQETVASDFNEAIAAGGRGTPFTVVLVNGDVVTTIEGAQSYANVKGVIEQILAAGGAS